MIFTCISLIKYANEVLKRYLTINFLQHKVSKLYSDANEAI